MPLELSHKQSFRSVFYALMITIGLVVSFGSIFTAEDLLSADNAVGLTCMLLSSVAMYCYAERWFTLLIPKTDGVTLDSYWYLKACNELWSELDMGIMLGIIALICAWMLTFIYVNLRFDEVLTMWWLYLLFVSLLLLSLYGCINLLSSAWQKIKEL